MHIVALAWMFVVVLMALAEATSSPGTVLGAIFTLVLYGLLPLSIVLYLMGTPMRRRARQAKEASRLATDERALPASGAQRHGGGHPASTGVAPERKEP